MKVAVITRHAISNYGSLLQAIATQRILEKCGCQCEIIDYVRRDEEPNNWEKTTLLQKKAWNNNLIKRLCYLSIRQPESILAGGKFQKMRQQYLKLTTRYSNYKELKIQVPVADIYMTGSDQVWGPVACGEYDLAYFLSFLPEGKRKIAFGSSMGKMKLSAETLQLFRENLSSYEHIAVREKSAVEFLKKQGISCQNVLDPTLLLTEEEWEAMTAPSKNNNYLLIYQLHSDKRVGDYAEKIAKKMGVQILRVSPSFHQFKRGGKFVYLPDVTEFLSLIKNAAFMVTDSFHGTAFAINFNIPFAEVLPDNGTSSRNVSILQITGLEDRIVATADDVERLSKNVDFSFANKILEQKRKESIEILKQMLM